jgi:hypothetical protein
MVRSWSRINLTRPHIFFRSSSPLLQLPHSTMRVPSVRVDWARRRRTLRHRYIRIDALCGEASASRWRCSAPTVRKWVMGSAMIASSWFRGRRWASRACFTAPFVASRECVNGSTIRQQAARRSEQTARRREKIGGAVSDTPEWARSMRPTRTRSGVATLAPRVSKIGYERNGAMLEPQHSNSLVSS